LNGVIAKGALVNHTWTKNGSMVHTGLRGGRPVRIAAIEYEGRVCVAKVNREGTAATILSFKNGHLIESVPALLSTHAAEFEIGKTVMLEEVSLLAPIPRPARNIFCVGKNYAEHARELATSIFKDVLFHYPIVFSKVPETVIGPGEPIMIDPAVSTDIDYEVELAVIIGKTGRNIAKEEAMAHVWGYTIVNDVTARDLQQRHGQWYLGKSQDTFCPMGPWAVTADAIDLANTGVRTFVNGELRQNSNTRDLIFDVPTLIATISNGITLKPGDIIATGTPEGVGAGFRRPKFLKDGDVVRVEIDGIGALENPVKVVMP
jgi:2-keto-4-pentenoate hydratase/2-oxohepta-3-ene-1,7-dioic acid hydratase in catechol pathway